MLADAFDQATRSGARSAADWQALIAEGAEVHTEAVLNLAPMM